MTASRERCLKWALYLSGFLAACFFVMTKDGRALRWATEGSYAYGDLYRFAQVRHFKPAASLAIANSTPDSLESGRPTLGEAEAFFFGDSFGSTAPGGAQFNTELARASRLTIFSVDANLHPEAHRRPGTVLKERLTRGFSPPRVVILEMAERLIPQYFSTETCLGTSPVPVEDHAGMGSLVRLERAFLADTELRHRILLRHGRFWSPLVEGWNSSLYTISKSLPSEVSLSSHAPPFLFFTDEVATFRKAFTDEEIGVIADHLGSLSRLMHERFHSSLLFVPVPNKISLYSSLASKAPYNQLLPRLVSALRDRGVSVVDLLTPFRQEKELLYWPSDTHWNQRGVALAVVETMRLLAAFTSPENPGPTPTSNK